MAEAKAHNRYRVIERLESGGMAEVFRGEAESLAGFKKQVAIKRVLPHLAKNERFIRMFLDEARLCARLNNANIVQVFDIGHVENTYFIVMEFVDGVNLKAIIEYTRKRNQTVPLGPAVYSSIQICNGLQYAHDVTDSEGKSLNIVHRDMSPPNVLISKRGEIKIVDFGLAKAASQVEKTDPGVVKGKFGYLAPEVAMGKEADPQADIFAVGIMLWEMLSGRRLFLGETDFQTVRLVQQANIPSLRKLNAEVPEALEVIINRALAREKSQRYDTADKLAGDLAQFLANSQIAVTSFDIAKIVREVVEEKRAQQKKEGKPDVSMIDKLIQEELMRFTSLDEPDGGNKAETQVTSVTNPGEGSQPLDPGGFVDTKNWASDLLDDFDLPEQGGVSGWRQPGLADSEPAAEPPRTAANLAEELEGDDVVSSEEDLSPPQSPPNLVTKAAATPEPAATAPVATAPTPPAVQPPKTPTAEPKVEVKIDTKPEPAAEAKAETKGKAEAKSTAKPVKTEAKNAALGKTDKLPAVSAKNEVLDGRPSLTGAQQRQSGNTILLIALGVVALAVTGLLWAAGLIPH